VENKWCYVAVTCLPEGVRLLSVFLSADEYKDLIRCCGPSYPELDNKSTDPVQQHRASERHTVHAGCTPAAVGDTDVGVFHLENVGEKSGKQTDGENNAEVFASESQTQCHGRHLETDESAAVYKSLAISS